MSTVFSAVARLCLGLFVMATLCTAPMLLGCEAHTTLRYGPSGPGWMTCNQGYNLHTMSSSSSGDYTYTQNTSTMILYDGSYLESVYTPTCENCGWVEECNLDAPQGTEDKR